MRVATNTPSAEVDPAIGESEAFLDLQERISLAAKADRPVILIGERGTGKELAAARLHFLSRRWNHPYITLNCASLSPTLIESELFGHEAGAFTGAIRLRKGRFELASGGSLFLDEAGNIPLTAQEKILRVVEYGRMERVGGSDTIASDVRLIAATNVDLRALAARGRFRQDLLDRLSFEVIVLPPLRERREDILILARHFARRMAGEMGMEGAPEFSERGARAMLDYSWPGNIRELKNVVERMVYRAEGGPIDDVIFDPFDSPYMKEVQSAECSAPDADSEGGAEEAGESMTGKGELGGGGLWGGRNERNGVDARQPMARWCEGLSQLPLEQATRSLEVRRLCDALTEARFNQREAAQRLGLTYNQFRGYYRKYRDEILSQPQQGG